MLVKQTIFSFIYFIIQYASFTPFVSLLNKNYVESKKCIFFAIFSAFISVSFYLILANTGIINVIYILVIFCVSLFIFNMNTSSALFFTTICSLALFITNTFCLSLNVFSNTYIIFNSLIFFTIAYALYSFLCTHGTKIFVNSFKILPELYFLILILILSYNFTCVLNLEVAYFSLFIQIVLAIILLQITKYEYNIKKMEVSFSSLKFEYNKLKSFIDDIRIFKHDYNNTLCSIGGYISLNDMKGLEKFYNKLTFDITKTNTTQIINPSIINEPSIYNLLITKHNEIIRNNLKFNFYSAINYKDLNISPYDFSKILGIFLDNAIYAANKSDEKEIYLSCEMNKNKDYKITIKNSYTNKDVDINKIFLKGYSSKTVKSGLRIMGS